MVLSHSENSKEYVKKSAGLIGREAELKKSVDKPHKHRIVIKRVDAEQVASPRREAARMYKEKDPELWAALMVQRNLRRCLFVSAVEKLLVFNARRRKILREALVAEETYVQCLFKLKLDFMVPLSNALQKPVIIDTIFPRVNEIWKLHAKLYR